MHVVLTFKSVDETLGCDHSNETFQNRNNFNKKRLNKIIFVVACHLKPFSNIGYLILSFVIHLFNLSCRLSKKCYIFSKDYLIKSSSNN